MSRYTPAILGVLVIVGLTIPQILMSDRFADSNVTAEEQSKLLENVPKDFGDWVGSDMEITDDVRNVAGAVGAISRSYRNKRTGDEVRLWLIVGHARPVSAHTPNICYPSTGFVQRAPDNALHPFAFPGQLEAPFWTNTFTKEDATGRHLERVFWSWYNPMDENAKKGIVTWQAVENPRWKFGNTRALYKMYFASNMRDPRETSEESSCARFARDFLPVVGKALSQTPAGEDAAIPAATEAAPAAATEAEPAAAEPAATQD
jgi:Protein of unknown function (DUF3485)